MKRLSSSDAIWPAFQKTWHDLLDSYAWPRYLKLCGIATVAEGILVCYCCWVRNDLTAEVHPPDFRTVWHSPYFPMVVWAAITVITIFCIAYYTVIRLRFVLFHSLAFGTRDFGDCWALYGKAALRMSWACVLSWLVVFVCLAVQGIVMAVGGVTVLTVRPTEDTFDPGVFLLMYLFALLAAFLLMSFIAIVRIVLHDFILPHMALEQLPFSNAWSACRTIIAAEKETFFWYLVLRMTLSIILWAVVTTVATSLGYLLLWVWNATAIGWDLLLGDMEGVGNVIKWIFDIGFVLCGILTGSLLTVLFGGPLGVWTRNFALLFYAGRYPPLGKPISTQVPELGSEKCPPHVIT